MTGIETGKIRVLLIDSAQQMVDELQKIFENHGYEVIAMQTGGKGLQQMSIQFPDIILADLALPDMTGIELLKQIKAIDPEMKVLLMGAHITSVLICEAIRFGAVELLYKAFVACSIIHKIEYLLSHDPRVSYNGNRKKSA